MWKCKENRSHEIFGDVIFMKLKCSNCNKKCHHVQFNTYCKECSDIVEGEYIKGENKLSKTFNKFNDKVNELYKEKQ